MVAVTRPIVDGVDDPEEFIAYCARVSNPTNQMNSETSSRLLQYLIKHKHWSPFEMVSATLEIETTRDVARQLLRHRTFAFQEFSQRYAEASTEFEHREARLQDHKNRQNSLEVDDNSLQEKWLALQSFVAGASKSAYEEALSMGIAKEVARAVLPEGMTPSRLYATGSIRTWLHYVAVRTDPSTQKEHRLLADDCRRELELVFPSVFREKKNNE